MFEKIYQAFEEELSGINAKNMASQIFQFDRKCTFPEYAKSADYCCQLLRSIGLEAKVWEFPADGKTVYGDWQMPKGWDSEDGELRIIEPENRTEVLASYRDEPLSLAMYSSSTPETGVEAELIYIEDASNEKNYQGLDVNGKIVFTSSSADAAKLAHQKGALGLISDYMPVFDTARETPMDLSEGRVWSRIDRDANCFAFVITPRQGINLRTMLKRYGKIKVHAYVKAKVYDDKVRIVDALIPGQREEEVLVIAHLFEPGANDNASGAALTIEIARALQNLISRNKLWKSKRGIRLLLSHEFRSTMAYICTQKEIASRIMGGINPDMVGEDQELCKSALTYHNVPDACFSYLMYFSNKLFSYHQETMTNPKRGRQYQLFWCLPAKYDGNDCIISDPSIGIPTIQITQWPDRFYHTSLDTPDKISEYSMKKTGVIVGTFAYFLANAGPKEAIWLADQIFLEAENNMGLIAQKILSKSRDEVLDMKMSPDERAERCIQAGSKIGKKLDYLLERDTNAILEIAKLAQNDEVVSKHINQLKDRLKQSSNWQKHFVMQSMEAFASYYEMGESKASKLDTKRPGEDEARKIIPKRKVIGTLTFATLSEDKKKRLEEVRKGIPGSFVFWVDGKRNLLKIAEMLEQENDQSIDLEQIIRYNEFLMENGYIEAVML